MENRDFQILKKYFRSKCKSIYSIIWYTIENRRKRSVESARNILVLAWAELHKDELMQDWELAREHQPLYKIAPLS